MLGVIASGAMFRGSHMISPYVRRHRLNTELRAIRKAAELNHTELGQLVKKSRLQISRHENGTSLVDLDLVMQILEKLQITGERWTQIVDAAREAGERGRSARVLVQLG